MSNNENRVCVFNKSKIIVIFIFNSYILVIFNNSATNSATYIEKKFLVRVFLRRIDSNDIFIIYKIFDFKIKYRGNEIKIKLPLIIIFYQIRKLVFYLSSSGDTLYVMI